MRFPLGFTTYQFPQDVDLIEQHFLLVIVHMALSQYFNSTLGSSLSMDTHSHFSECTYMVRRVSDELIY